MLQSGYSAPPLGADPAESIVLMSQAKVLIISNSTFSWWAACLASMESTIYSPSNWFKNLEAPKDLLMNSWRLVESKWKNQDE
jgi:hypothetical protein